MAGLRTSSLVIGLQSAAAESAVEGVGGVNGNSAAEFAAAAAVVADVAVAVGAGAAGAAGTAAVDGDAAAADAAAAVDAGVLVVAVVADVLAAVGAAAVDAVDVAGKGDAAVMTGAAVSHSSPNDAVSAAYQQGVLSDHLGPFPFFCGRADPAALFFDGCCEADPGCCQTVRDDAVADTSDVSAALAADASDKDSLQYVAVTEGHRAGSDWVEDVQRQADWNLEGGPERDNVHPWVSELCS